MDRRRGLHCVRVLQAVRKVLGLYRRLVAGQVRTRPRSRAALARPRLTTLVLPARRTDNAIKNRFHAAVRKIERALARSIENQRQVAAVEQETKTQPRRRRPRSGKRPKRGSQKAPSADAIRRRLAWHAGALARP